MREIKFRAWDKRNNRIEYSCNRYIIWDGKVGIYDDNGDFEEDKDLILIQFTGLKDRNEKEVYDGDIFKSPSGILFYVLWYRDGWCYNNVNDDPEHISGRLSEIANYWKVIGNIYENPELVKE